MEQPFETDPIAAATEVARFLDRSGATDVVALDVRKSSAFTDCFVIAGAASAAQMRGLQRRLVEVLEEMGLQSRRSSKQVDESGWLLIDCYSVIVHIMLKEQRDFYGLERLWFDADLLYGTIPA